MIGFIPFAQAKTMGGRAIGNSARFSLNALQCTKLLLGARADSGSPLEIVTLEACLVFRIYKVAKLVGSARRDRS